MMTEFFLNKQYNLRIQQNIPLHGEVLMSRESSNITVDFYRRQICCRTKFDLNFCERPTFDSIPVKRKHHVCTFKAKLFRHRLGDK